MNNNFLSRWAQFFVTRYKTTILLVVAIIVIGVWGTLNNQRQDFPAIPSNFVMVQGIYPGASATDVENKLVVPLEQAVSEIKEVDTIRSTASDSVGVLFLEMNSNSDMDTLVSDIDKLVSQVELPADAETSVQLYDVVGPTFVYAITSAVADQKTLLEHVDVVQDRLLASSSDILKVQVMPTNEFEVRVQYKQTQLENSGLTGQEVTAALQSALIALPGGTITNTESGNTSISIDPAVTSLDTLRAIEIKGTRLDELADISRDPTERDEITLAGYLDEAGNPVSRESVYLFVYKKDDGDVIRMSEALQVEAEHINQDQVLPEEISLQLLYDNSSYVEKQISDLLYNGFLGLLLILGVLMVFINLRTGIVVALIIPLAFLGTLGILYAIGFSINILTLFGLLLVLGIIVDNAIVIAEAVTHGMEKGQPKAEAIKQAMQDLGPAVTTATLTTVVVFIPFASIGGIIGEFLKYIPYTIIITLVVSYFLAITITPVLSQLIMREPKPKKHDYNPVNWLERKYELLIGMIYKNFWSKLATIGITLGLMAVSFAVYAPKLAVQQFPTDDGNALSIQFDFPTSLLTAEKNDVIARVMDEAVKTSYFKSYYLYEGQVFFVVEEPADRTDDRTITDLHAELETNITDVRAELADNGIDITVAPLSTGPPEDVYDVTVEIRGDSQAALISAGTELATALSAESGVTEVYNSAVEEQVTTLQVTPDNVRLADNNIDPLIANSIINSVFSATTIGTIITSTNGDSDDVIVSYTAESTDSVDDLNDLTIGAGGFPPRLVQVSDVADVLEVTGLQSIQRLNQMKTVTVKAKVSEDVTAADIEAVAKEKLVGIAETYEINPDNAVYGGVAAANNENYNNLVLVFIIAMITVYLILVYQFNSFIEPGLIMFTVPLAFIGVFPGLFYINSSLNMISGLGVIALVGIVVNDAIVFIDYYNRLRKNKPDWDLVQVIVETGRARFKPILSTSITTIFGILPLAITDPFWRGLGTSLVTGLICSTIGTLIVFPILLYANDKFWHFVRLKCSRFIKTA